MLVGANAFAASGSGNVSNVTALGGVSTTPSINISNGSELDYFAIYGSVSAPTAGGHFPFAKDGADYQVTTGKTFVASVICAASSASSQLFQMVNTTAAITPDSASVTGGVYMGGAINRFPLLTALTAINYQCFNTQYRASQNTFVGFQAAGTSAYRIFVIGKEI